MSENSRLSPFSNVDQFDNAEWCIDRLDAQHGADFVRRRKLRGFELLQLSPGQRVLDVGCGTGLDAQEIASRIAPGGGIVGVDFSLRMIHEAVRRKQSHVQNAMFAQQDVHSLGFADATFDRCFAERVFQHLAHPRDALREVWRVVKPGGIIVIIEPDHDSVVIDASNKALTRRFVQWRSDSLAAGDVAHRIYCWLAALGCTSVGGEPWTQTFTDYAERKAVAPYLDEVQLAVSHGIASQVEADAWCGELQAAIDAGRFFSMQTFFLTAAVK